MFLKKIQSKILTRGDVVRSVAGWRRVGERIVFTNGCFDLLHYGHVCYLAQARELGDRLVVGVNSDESVGRLKGPGRPVKDERTRLYLLAAFEYVDVVVLFEEDTPYELIKALEPDVLVKGGDWAVEDIVGSDLVLAGGGEVRSLPFVEGFSTTGFIQKIKGFKQADGTS